MFGVHRFKVDIIVRVPREFRKWTLIKKDIKNNANLI